MAIGSIRLQISFVDSAEPAGSDQITAGEVIGCEDGRKLRWQDRIAIDHQIGRKDKTDTALLERIIVNSLGQSEFFINKAIGWSLREYSKTDPGWVRGFIGRHGGGMAALSVREAGKYL
jgi:3-methyladenine DNA glycosylase AlkD